MYKAMDSAKRLSQIIGGKCYLIGGAVIDKLQNREIKDWDIEVYGRSLADIESSLKNQGLESNMVGASFGIIKTKFEGLDIDLSVPRRENRVGIGHKGFEVELDPSMTPEEAGIRRDLTINSMYLDIETGCIVDHFGGIDDLRNGVLRATCSETFIEDPLRVLRIMQLLPRKGKRVSTETIMLCQNMVGEFQHLPKERVFAEFEKLLLKTTKPSEGIRFLVECMWIKHFPEIEAMIGCEQNEEWHPEGDVFEHTMIAFDLMAKIKHRVKDGSWHLPMMFGILLHDCGKPICTEEDLTSHGHDVAGVPIAEAFMNRITDDKQLIERTVSIVKNHMTCGQLHHSNCRDSAWKRLHNKLRLDVAACVSMADGASRFAPVLELIQGFGDTVYDSVYDAACNVAHGSSKQAMEYFDKFGEEKIEPIVKGRHLIEKGLNPGKIFKIILDAAYEYQIDTGSEDIQEILEHAMQTYNK